jgi:hypothetical protein
MARIRANNAQPTAALHARAMQTDFFDGCFYFHVFEIFLPSTSDTGATSIWVEVHLHLIPYQHFDAMQTHFTGKIGENKSIFFASDFDTKKRIRKRLFDDSFYNF